MRVTDTIWTLAILSAATAAAGQAPPAASGQPPAYVFPPDAPRNVRDAKAVLAAAPKVTIRNGQLTAVLLPPDAARGLYRGTRFDYAGIVSSVTYKGQEYYGLWFDKVGDGLRDFAWDGDSVVAGPNTAVVGPTEAFDTASPPGWAEAAPGGGFLKIGVGMLRKPDDGANYSQFRVYEFIDRGTWTVTRGAEWVTFTHRLTDKATGYGYVYRKTVRLTRGAPEMTLEHELRNTGTRPIASTMFNHNFLTFGGDPTAQLPTVSAPYPIAALAPPRSDAARLIDGRVQYQRPVAREEVFSFGITGFQSVADAQFTVASKAGAAVRLVSDRPWTRVALWSIPRAVAVEPFVAIDAAPGETTRWQTRYGFTAAR